MKIILGGGVIGVTTAYYLAKAGHAVTVVERRSSVALETSFANAGEVSPGYAAPWAGPGIPKKAIKWLLMKHGPLKLRPTADPYMWLWLLQMLRNCTSARYAVNKGRMVGIAEYSRDCLKALRAETGIRYDERAQGTLQLFRTQAQLDHAADDIAVLKHYGVPFELLDGAGCIAAEPGLAAVPQLIAGGLRLPGDETGDCHQFTRNLATLAAGLGVKFLLDTKIDGLVTEGDRIAGVATSAGMIRGEEYVLALGSYSPFLVRPLGIRIPVYPIKGYSITVPILDAARAPVSTVMDESYKVAITRLGDRIRVGGTAEVSGFDHTLRPARKATLDQSVGDLFPGAGDLARASFWCGLRPMTPDGPPIIGGTKFRNLTLNTGHGTLGWTMACGSGRVVADLLSGRKPETDLSELGLSRYR
jgi:D-amino-acid dehydrogenase